MPKYNINDLNLIFVDDEQSILDGINRILRRLKPHWKIQYFANPVDALLYYKNVKEGLDVIVCDINMPGVNGVQFMQAIFEHNKDVIRILLSGQLDIKSMVGANKYADCHICKPVDIDILCNKIIELCQTRLRNGI